MFIWCYTTIPSDRKPSRVCAAYKCLKRCMMREGYEMDSPKVGVLEVGETVMVAERREHEASIFRCKFIAPNGATCWLVLKNSYTHPGNLLICLSRQADGFCRCICLLAGLVRHRRLARPFCRRPGDRTSVQDVCTSVQLGYLCESTNFPEQHGSSFSIVGTDKARWYGRAGPM